MSGGHAHRTFLAGVLVFMLFVSMLTTAWMMMHWMDVGEYHSCHQVVKWFWKAVENMSHEERIRLLQFSTGVTTPCIFGWCTVR
jgi:hypothetical protein